MQDRQQFELAISYTKERTAAEGEECGKCRVALQQGARLNWVANKEAGLPGRFICMACWTRALQKPTTVVRPSSSVAHESNSRSNRYTPDTASIRHAVNTSQRGAIMPGNRVVAMSTASANPLGLNARSILGPQPYSGPSRLSGPFPKTRGPLLVGYTQDHHDYNEQRKKWAHAAQSGLPPLAEVSVRRVPGGAAIHGLPPIPFFAIAMVKNSKRKDVAITNAEGHHIQFNALPTTIVQTVITVLKKPVVEYCKGYEPNWDKMTVREKSTMVDLRRGDLVPQDRPYLIHRELEFFKEKKGRLSHVLNKFRLTFLLEISYEECLKIEAYLESLESEDDGIFGVQASAPGNGREKMEDGRQEEAHFFHDLHQKRMRSVTADTTNAADSSGSSRVSKRPRVVSPTVRGGTRDSPLEITGSTESLPSVGKVMTRAPLVKDFSHSNLSDSEEEPTATHEPTAPLSPTLSYVGEMAAPGSTIPTLSTPKKVQRGTNAPTTPNLRPSSHDVAMMAQRFTWGGSSKPDSQQGIYVPWSDIEKFESPIQEGIEHAELGLLHYDVRQFLARGSMKCSFKSYITHSSLFCDPRDSKSLVILKRPYTTALRGKQERIIYLKAADEYTTLYTEATQLVWANSLLDLAYACVDSTLHKSIEPPPFKIPRLRYVKAALASDSMSITPGPSKDKELDKGCRSFLLEEYIDVETQGEFVKYIHNQSLVPDEELSVEKKHVAEFLCFTQHVQYTATGHLAFVSDYQGAGDLLTDPQIMTSPELGSNLFGDGNIGMMVLEFPLKHKCNQFCQWFQLPPVRPQPGAASGKRSEESPAEE